MYANDESVSNQALRERFVLDEERKDARAMSRLTRECVDGGLAKEENENTGPKSRRYIPSWA